MANGNFFKWVKNTLSNVLKDMKSEYPYKLVDYNYSENEKKFLITVQLKNKDIKQELDPEALLSDNALVQMMSPENIRLITYLACKNKFFVTYKVVSENFNEAGEKGTIEIRHLETNKVETKLIGEILGNKEYLHRMHPDDILRLGFALGVDSATNERIDDNR